MTKHRNTQRYKKRYHKKTRKGGRTASNSPSNNSSDDHSDYRSFTPINIITSRTGLRRGRNGRRNDITRRHHRTRLEDQDISQDEINARLRAGWRWNEGTGGWMRISRRSGGSSKSKTNNSYSRPIQLTDILDQMKNDKYIQRINNESKNFKNNIQISISEKRKKHNKKGGKKSRKIYRGGYPLQNIHENTQYIPRSLIKHHLTSSNPYNHIHL